MQTESRNGMFTLSIPDTAKTSEICPTLSEDEYDKEVDVNIVAVEEKNPSLRDLAETIEFDCFDMDCVGLHLLAKSINCHVTVGARKYEFNVEKWQSPDDYLSDISDQLKL